MILMPVRMDYQQIGVMRNNSQQHCAQHAVDIAPVLLDRAVWVSYKYSALPSVIAGQYDEMPCRKAAYVIGCVIGTIFSRSAIEIGRTQAGQNREAAAHEAMDE